MIDYKEIPQANSSDGEQDSFELFTRDFLLKLGFKVNEDPARGSDGGLGKDLIVTEIRDGITGDNETKWLVSCKHYAHSGKSVGVSDESSILDRVKAADCDGFMGGYSTLQSSGLQERILGISANTDVKTFVFDKAKIEDHLTTKDYLFDLALRYFPTSFKPWYDLKATNIETKEDHSELIVRGTYTCDLDRGLVGVGRANSDFHWNIISIKTDEKYLQPWNNAEFVIIEGRSFEEITKEFVSSQTLNKVKLPGQAKTGLLKSGVIVGYKTKNGNFGKMEIVSIGYNLEFKSEYRTKK